MKKKNKANPKHSPILLKTRLAIFCSGSGSNAQKIMEHFRHHETIEVVLLLANKPDAYALIRAQKLGVSQSVFNRHDFYQTDKVVNRLKQHEVDVVVLAGFLWLIPNNMLQAFPDRIINIHPSLLPKFGGKGMYGSRVHEAVKKAGETESGLTIHLVNEDYDKGRMLFQACCPVHVSDTAEDIAARVLALEHKHFPEVVEQFIKNQHTLK